MKSLRERQRLTRRCLFRLSLAVLALSHLHGCSRDDQIVSPVEPPAESPRVEPQPLRPTGTLPKFDDIADQIGIDFNRYDDMRGRHTIMESNGGGVALFDFDLDGRLDCFFTDGCRLPLKAANDENSNRLYRQGSEGWYSDVTRSANLWRTGYFHGCAIGDVDSDGFDDIYATAFGSNRLWHNNGDGTFTDITERTQTEVAVWSSSAAFADFNCDGHLDLFVTNYVQASDNLEDLCKDDQSPDGYITCPPTVFRAESDVILQSDGEGGFTDITQSANVVGADGKGLGVVVFDCNQDGWPDIYVANDGMPNFLYLNDGVAASRSSAIPPEIRFTEVGNAYGAAVNELWTAEASMGIAHGDVNGDGWIDLFVTHFYTETNTLYHNMAGHGFYDATKESKLGPASRLRLGFGCEFLDFDNNGDLDLFVANGHIDDLQWQPTHPPYAMSPQFFRNDGTGRYVEVSEWSGKYFESVWLGRGVAAGDLDNDGDIDIAVSHQRSRSAILENSQSTDHKSVLLQLVGTHASRSGFNVRVEARIQGRTLVREVVGGGSYQSASDQRVHVGLTDSAQIDDLTIRWPSGVVDQFAVVEPGTYLAREGGQLLWRLSPDRQ